MTALVLVTTTLAASYVAPASAECLPFPTQSQATVTVTIPAPGDYRLWIRQLTPSNGNPIFIKLDDECPLLIPKNNTPNEFAWIGVHDPNQPLVFNLTAGVHTLLLAGNQTGVQVDKGLFAADRNCVPVESGDNCLNVETTVESPTTTESGTPVINGLPIDAPIVKKAVWLWVIIGAVIGLGFTIGFLLWRYYGFIKKVIVPATASLPPDGLAHVQHISHHAFKLSTAQHFLNHHRIFAAICGVVMALLIASLTLGIVNADSRPVFEMKNAVLSGEAAVTETGAVIFGRPPVATNNLPNPSGSTPGTTPTPGGGSTPTPGGGDSGGGGGGGTPTGECPPFPSFPDENCTGWQHTGVVLHECATDNGYIWDSNVTFDSCYFPQPLTIYGSNITITRSQIHGTVTPHWSKTYDFGGLTLRDVEIEQTGVDDINSAAIAGHNYSCLRCNVHHTLSGMHFGNNTTIRDSYTHDFQYRDGVHGTGIGAGQGHGANSFIIHNNAQCNRISGLPICSSALSIYPEPNDQGTTVHTVRVEKNLFNTSGAYCVYAGGLPAVNIDFIDNHFGKKFHPGCAGYGPVAAYEDAGGLWVGNVWADGSGPVNPY